MIKRVTEHPNITVKLCTEATPALIEAEAPYAVIAATGAEIKRPDIPGSEKAQVLTVLEAYERQESLHGKILLVGSGMTGCESALHFNNLGLQVAIVGRRDRILFHEHRLNEMPTALYNPAPTFLEWFGQRGLPCTERDCVRRDKEVVLRDIQTGEVTTVPADYVILAGGVTARSAEAYQFRNTAPFFAMAGDCVRPKKIREAVSSAYWAAMEI